MSAAETANEPFSRRSSDDDECLEICFRRRPWDAATFGEEERFCVTDIARIGRLDADQWAQPDIVFPASDSETSRHHGVIALSREDGLRLTYYDLRSGNGTFIGAERVVHCPVIAGLRLRLGQGERRSEIEFTAVHEVRPRVAEFWPHDRFGSLRGESAALRRLFAALADVAERGAAHRLLVLQGPGGSGKKAAMWELLRRWYTGEPPTVRYVDCRWLALDAGLQPLSALLDGTAQVVVFDHLYGLSTRHQKDLGTVLQRAATGSSTGPRVVTLLRANEPHRQRIEIRDAGLLKVLSAAPTLRFPSAAICGPREVVRFAVQFLRQYQEDAPTGSRHDVKACTLSPAVLDVLAQEPWPGNWGQLRTVVESASIAVAADGRATIEVTDLQIGFSETHLPLELIYGLPLQQAEEQFRQAYLMAAMRRFAANLSHMASAMQFSKRGLLKAAHEVGMHDGEQLTPPRVPIWMLQDPRRAWEDDRLRVAVPSAFVWLERAAAGAGGQTAVRARMFALLEHHAAAAVEQALRNLLLVEKYTFKALEQALQVNRRGARTTDMPPPLRPR